ncbi:hypothetical protein DPMN_189457 [Dreissena polymorpha]|uniref:Uncharacterized protein n=1 Tax=Dreissena polymorpha TaxID=45954 RepID=A0A9D4DSU4_DREPO|nr:hypothetical protein DPMN_189457 [Dreissena polymorpha]
MTMGSSCCRQPWCCDVPSDRNWNPTACWLISWRRHGNDSLSATTSAPTDSM